jgi:hypothetical protein
LIICCKTLCWTNRWWPLQGVATSNGTKVHTKNDKDTCTDFIK